MWRDIKVPKPLRLVVTEGIPITVHSATEKRSGRVGVAMISKVGVAKWAWRSGRGVCQLAMEWQYLVTWCVSPGLIVGRENP